MNSEPLVAARDILRAIQEVGRVGAQRLLDEWERREPDLTEHLLEGLSDLNRQLAAIAAHPKAERRLNRRIETLILVLLTAQRRALLRHWQGEAEPSAPASNGLSAADPLIEPQSGGEGAVDGP
jgi:hypothetical protein